MRKQTHLKKAVSLALAAAMAVSVCTTALADEAGVTDVTENESVSEVQEEAATQATDPEPEAGNGTAVYTEGNVAQNVAQIGDEMFTSFAAALNKAEELDNAVITLLADVSIDDPIDTSRLIGVNFCLLKEGKSLTLDLNGKHIIVTGDRGKGDGSHRAFDNYGNLTIQDTSAGAAGYMQARNLNNKSGATLTLLSGTLIGSDDYGGSGVWNEAGATFTMNGGTLKTAGAADNKYCPTPLVNYGTATLNAGMLDGKQINLDVYGGTATVASAVKFSGTTNSNFPSVKVSVNEDTGTVGNVTLTGVTINSVNGSCIENEGAIATLNNCTFTETDVNDQQMYTANAVAVSYGGTVTINGGSYTGFKYGAYVYNSGGTIKITDGTFGATTVLKADNYNSYYDEDVAEDKRFSKIEVTDGKFSGAYGIGDQSTLAISAGYFTNEVDPKYIVTGKVCNKLDEFYEGTYGYQVGVKRAVEVKTDVAVKEPDVKQPAETIAEDKKDDAKDVASNTKLATTSTAGETNKTEETLTKKSQEVVSKVEDSAKERAETEYGGTVGTLEPEMAYVVRPYLEIEPKAYSGTPDADGKVLTLDITPKYDLVLTNQKTADEAKKDSTVIKTEGENRNAVTVAEKQDLEIKKGEEVNLSIEVNDTVKTALEGKNVFILHDHEGEKFVYEAKLVDKTISFTNPNGFSEFTVLAVNPTDVTQINFEGDNKSYGMDAVSAMNPFPTASKDGYTFKGWMIDGKVYTNMCYDLWSPTAAKTATAVFEKNPVTSDNSSSTPAPAATAAPSVGGNEVYYTCVACGHHDWTATAEGYKCNYCGHLESVKQLSGYANVKGVYEPKTSTAKAAAKSAVKSSSAIPQTSDDMPIVPIAVIAIAALLGLGVTVVLKRKHN